MGGHLHGEVASSGNPCDGQQIVSRLYLHSISDFEAEAIQEIMKMGPGCASGDHERSPWRGTTLTAALVFGNHVVVAHVETAAPMF
jgi:hypothetical protein